MANDGKRVIARVDAGELSTLPNDWSDRERGRYLRLLLQGKGIDPRRLFLLEYHPYHRCWVVDQRAAPRSEGHAASPGQADADFYRQAMVQFRRTARVACATLAARSTVFARYGGKYELPARLEKMSLQKLAEMLGGSGEARRSVQFTGEGGWLDDPSSN